LLHNKIFIPPSVIKNFTAAVSEESSISLDCIAQAINDATLALDKISDEMAMFSIKDP
jgi:hypothetical protein